MQRFTRSALQRLLILSTIAILWSSYTLSAQSITAARINEVMIDNVDNYIDSYGKRSPWIEIYNSSAGTIDLAGCFLTNDPQDLKKYMIPKGDILTIIKPRQSVVFFADEMPLRGTFHLNFTLTPESPHYLALVSSDGTSIIDEVEIPAAIPANHSYARIDDGVRTIAPAEAWHITQHTTPGSNNVVKDKNEKINRLQEADPNGFVMTITAMLVVFSGLLILFLAYKLVGIVAMRIEERKESLHNRVHREPTTVASTTDDPLVAVAISLALTTELQLGGGEAPGQLTIRPRTQAYEPWSDKSQMMRPTVECKRLKA
ncbi:OadG family transporter subunit [Porphyromonas uenonis]|uniref:OadG family transporter subunit n=1 Tax=Porphyromonas uenonis TaxID=281920 RepID=UPI00046F3D69|nr:OadG family transporter subunit [Porphyromonas uenonis]